MAILCDIQARASEFLISDSPPISSEVSTLSPKGTFRLSHPSPTAGERVGQPCRFIAAIGLTSKKQLTALGRGFHGFLGSEGAEGERPGLDEDLLDGVAGGAFDGGEFGGAPGDLAGAGVDQRGAVLGAGEAVVGVGERDDDAVGVEVHGHCFERADVEVEDAAPVIQQIQLEVGAVEDGGIAVAGEAGGFWPDFGFGVLEFDGDDLDGGVAEVLHGAAGGAEEAEGAGGDLVFIHAGVGEEEEDAGEEVGGRDFFVRREGEAEDADAVVFEEDLDVAGVEGGGVLGEEGGDEQDCGEDARQYFHANQETQGPSTRAPSQARSRFAQDDNSIWEHKSSAEEEPPTFRTS